MATPFTVSVMPSSGDFSSLNAALVACECDLTAASTGVFSITGGITGTMTDNTSVTGLTSGATGTCVHASSVNSQILIISISGTFQNGEIVYETLGTNYVTLGSVRASPYLNIKIDGTWSSPDTTAVAISGYTCSSTNYINIYTTPTARHNGTVSQGYMLYPSSSGANCIGTLAPIYLNITGLILKTRVQAYSSPSCIFLGYQGTSFYISDNILISDNGTINHSSTTGVQSYNNHGSVYVWNNLIYALQGTNSCGILSGGNYYDNIFVYNNTVVNCVVGINAQGTTKPVWLIKNNICVNNSTADYSFTNSSVFSSLSTNNLSSDATCPNIGTYHTGATVTFVNSGSGNFNLGASDTGATGLGANLSADTYIPFSNDIVGTSRTVPWDIGAFKATTVAVSAKGIMNLKTGWWGDI